MKSDNLKPGYFDIKGLSEYTSLSPRTIRKILSSPEGPASYRPGGKTLVKGDDWNDWMAQYRQEPAKLDALLDEVMAEFYG